MWKKILKSLALFLIDLAFKAIFKAIDKDKDGKLSEEEIKQFTNLIREKLRNIKK